MERGVPRLVINYKTLNKALKWIRYPIPNKKDLLDRLHEATIFSKFDMKNGFWQIEVKFIKAKKQIEVSPTAKKPKMEEKRNVTDQRMLNNSCKQSMGRS